jgi:hypothetical protein
VNPWLLALVLWLAFNASLLLFGWLSYRRDEARAYGEFSHFAEWEAELSRSSRETAMRQHPAGGSR